MTEEMQTSKLHVSMPPDAEYIIETLERNGFEAYVVGGCVRDCLLGKEPGDWDITTSAKPQEIKAVFRRTIDTGIAHGTVTVMRGRQAYEVTTYRIDGEYEDGRHPKSVQFTSRLEEDLKRRDFTVNAMAYSHKAGLIDVFDGRRDLREGRIRCVGNAADRFTEDALRILRALRFSAQLGFDIEENTREALRQLASNLVHVSKERIQTELTKLLISPNPHCIRMVFDDGIAPYISETFPRIDPEKAVMDTRLPALPRLRWAALLRFQTGETAQRILKELKMDNDTIARVKLLVTWWREPVGTHEAAIRRTMSQMAPDAYDDLLTMKESVDGAIECPNQLETIRHLTALIRQRGDCVSLKTLAVTGNDLISQGMKPGKAVGEALHALLELVLEDPGCNEKQRLMEELHAKGYGNPKKST